AIVTEELVRRYWKGEDPADRDPLALIAPLREELRRVDPDQAIANVSPRIAPVARRRAAAPAELVARRLRRHRRAARRDRYLRRDGRRGAAAHARDWHPHGSGSGSTRCSRLGGAPGPGARRRGAPPRGGWRAGAHARD